MREKLSMDFAWRFHLDDLEWPQIKDLNYYYLHTKAERGIGPAAASFYDLDWKLVDLPHDYAIEGGVDFSGSATEGFVPRKNGWYRRMFRLHPEDEGKRIALQFDGVSTHCTVYVNGHLLYRNFCGYTSFSFDITEFVDFGERLNVVSVYVDTREFEGWWYEGAGIYRHVWLIKTAPVSVETWGTFVQPRETEDGVWEVPAEVQLRSILYEEKEVTLRNRIFDGLGNCIAEAEETLTAKPRELTAGKALLTVSSPRLWSVEDPYLYTLRSTVEEEGKEIDTYETVFGFRTIEFTAEGFFLNGKPVKLKGVCAHEDHANLGVAVPDAVREYRMKQLKAMGCNAYRCSHNPPTPEVLDLCDRLGILVMDENRWFGCAQEDLRQLTHMMKRDRNHPCIIMWSMANEERIQGTERGKRIMRSMRYTARKYDISRPIMMAMDGGCMSDSGAAGVSDVIGINYQMELFDRIHEKFPGVPLVASEIGGKMLNYGVMGDGSGEDWESVDTRAFMTGMFKWAAFGYRGEARSWPRIYSRSGIIEPTGTPKENTWFYKQMWDESQRFVKLWPLHWNHPGKEGEEIKVCVYSNGDQVELFRDGVSLGKVFVNRYRRTEFSVTYMPGVLTAVAYENGAQCVRDEIATTGAEASLVLTANKASLLANRTDVTILSVGVKDASGKDIFWSQAEVEFLVEGPAEVLAVSNNDPYDTLGAKVLKRKLYRGICQLILRSTTSPGTVTVRAVGKGMKEGVLKLQSFGTEREPHVAMETDTDALWYFAKMDGSN